MRIVWFSIFTVATIGDTACSSHCVQHQLARNKVRKTRVATNWEWKQTLRLSRHFPKIVTSYAPREEIGVWYCLYLALLCSLVSDSNSKGLFSPKWAINKRLIRGNGPRYAVGRSLRPGSIWTIMLVYCINLRMGGRWYQDSSYRHKFFRLCRTTHLYWDISTVLYCRNASLY